LGKQCSKGYWFPGIIFLRKEYALERIPGWGKKGKMEISEKAGIQKRRRRLT